MQENICKGCNWQGINLQNLPTSHAAQYQKSFKKPFEKQAEDLNRHFSKEDTDGQKAHEKMLNTANYYRDAN